MICQTVSVRTQAHPIVGMSGKRKHAWESEGPTRRHNWEESSGEGEGPDNPEDSDEEKMTPQTASDELLAVLIGMLMGGTMGATTFCIICFWCWKAGLHSCKEYGYPPNKGTSK